MIDDLFYFDYVNDVERFIIDMYLFMMKLIFIFEVMICVNEYIYLKYMSLCV